MTLVNGPASIEECENDDCTGCPWCDALGVTVEPIEAIGRLLDAHNSGASPLDPEQVLERIAAIVDLARRDPPAPHCHIHGVYGTCSACSDG